MLREVKSLPRITQLKGHGVRIGKQVLVGCVQRRVPTAIASNASSSLIPCFGLGQKPPRSDSAQSIVQDNKKGRQFISATYKVGIFVPISHVHELRQRKIR